MLFNKFRLKVIEFIKKHEDKIKNVGQKLIIVAMVVLVATIIISSFSGGETEKNEDAYNVYKPTETIIKGQDVSKEQYEKDSNLVNTFLEYCNGKKVEEAYDLVSDECKNEKYPTIEKFKEYYYNDIFEKKRECNLQAWISTDEYTIYKIRYSNSMISTGTYDETDVYEDYITLNRKNNTEKISIGSFVDSEECNIVTNEDGIEATVIMKKIYISDEEYEIYVTNNTEKTILLDNLNSSTSILLQSSTSQYLAYTNKLFISNLIIEPGETQRLQIRFIKSLGSNSESRRIQFSSVIKDYEAYIQDETGYTDTTQIKIKVED